MLLTLVLLWGGYSRWHWKRIAAVVISALITQMFIDYRSGWPFDKNSGFVFFGALLFYWIGRGVRRMLRGSRISPDA